MHEAEKWFDNFPGKKLEKFTTGGTIGLVTPPMTNWGPFYYHGLTLIPTWISNYIHYKKGGMNLLIHS